MDALPRTPAPDQIGPHPIELVAIDPARNIRRRWSVTATRDLFGHVMVETRWGRIGARGRSLVRSFVDEAQAARHVAALLARRAGAVRRIGVAYRPDMSTRRHADTATLATLASPSH